MTNSQVQSQRASVGATILVTAGSLAVSSIFPSGGRQLQFATPESDGVLQQEPAAWWSPVISYTRGPRGMTEEAVLGQRHRGYFRKGVQPRHRGQASKEGTPSLTGAGRGHAKWGRFDPKKHSIRKEIDGFTKRRTKGSKMRKGRKRKNGGRSGKVHGHGRKGRPKKRKKKWKILVMRRSPEAQPKQSANTAEETGLIDGVKQVLEEHREANEDAAKLQSPGPEVEGHSGHSTIDLEPSKLLCNLRPATLSSRVQVPGTLLAVPSTAQPPALPPTLSTVPCATAGRQTATFTHQIAPSATARQQTVQFSASGTQPALTSGTQNAPPAPMTTEPSGQPSLTPSTGTPLATSQQLPAMIQGAELPIQYGEFSLKCHPIGTVEYIGADAIFFSQVSDSVLIVGMHNSDVGDLDRLAGIRSYLDVLLDGKIDETGRADSKSEGTPRQSLLKSLLADNVAAVRDKILKLLDSSAQRQFSILVDKSSGDGTSMKARRNLMRLLDPDRNANIFPRIVSDLQYILQQLSLFLADSKSFRKTQHSDLLHPPFAELWKGAKGSAENFPETFWEDFRFAMINMYNVPETSLQPGDVSDASARAQWFSKVLGEAAENLKEMSKNKRPRLLITKNFCGARFDVIREQCKELGLVYQSTFSITPATDSYGGWVRTGLQKILDWAFGPLTQIC